MGKNIIIILLAGYLIYTIKRIDEDKQTAIDIAVANAYQKAKEELQASIADKQYAGKESSEFDY